MASIFKIITLTSAVTVENSDFVLCHSTKSTDVSDVVLKDSGRGPLFNGTWNWPRRQQTLDGLTLGAVTIWCTWKRKRNSFTYAVQHQGINTKAEAWD